VAPDDQTAIADQRSDVGASLIAEATRKAGLIWLGYGPAAAATPERSAWHVWVDDAAYVVTGPGEQDLPGLAAATEITVIVPSKDTRARLVTWRGRASVVAPGSETWTAATAALAGGRLNAEGGTAMIDRWSRECTVVRIVPTGEVIETAEDPSPRSLAEPPRATTATTLGRQPWMLGGIRRPPR
jgi:hypothetical protein